MGRTIQSRSSVNCHTFAPDRAEAPAEGRDDALRLVRRPYGRGALALGEDRRLLRGAQTAVQQAARAEADVPALVAQPQLGAAPQAGQAVVEALEQGVLPGGEDHALED